MKHLINTIALLAGILAALAVCGCAGPCSQGPNTSGLGLDFDIPLPSFPTKPVCIPKDACVATYGDGWKVHSPCGEPEAQAQTQYAIVPMSAFNALFSGRQTQEDPREVLKRTVTTVYAESPDAAPAE